MFISYTEHFLPLSYFVWLGIQATQALGIKEFIKKFFPLFKLCESLRRTNVSV